MSQNVPSNFLPKGKDLSPQELVKSLSYENSTFTSSIWGNSSHNNNSNGFNYMLINPVQYNDYELNNDIDVHGVTSQ